MFSLNVIILIALAVLSADAFQLISSTSTLSSMKLHMNAWGVQKLGKSVLDTIAAEPEIKDEAPPSIFKRVPVGSGNDERKTIMFEKDQEKYNEEKFETLSTIDRSFQQKTLMMGLEGSRWGTAEKLQRIELATSQNLLPSSFEKSTVQSSNIRAGGLLEDDWDF